MRKIGIIMIAFGLAFLIFALINFFKEKNKIISPVPEDQGVKVIFVTPSK
ncbi:MAG: hypothetical protein N2593_00340 [Patescibacteria group bacterium]|nr:hypothetical protein [Patescibacteria group bacterium]